MPPTRSLRHLKLSLLAAVLCGGLAVGAQILPSLARSGVEAPSVDVQFRPVDRSGELPDGPGELGEPDAPLSIDERGYAIRLAQDAMPDDARDVLGGSGGEVLAADLPPLDERRPGRRVLVSLYDYRTDHVHQVLIDLAGDSVLRNETVPGLQLPPTTAEAAVATELAIAHDPAPAFMTEYLKVTRSLLLSADQVQPVAGIWRPTTTAAADSTAGCGTRRCVQLLLALPSGHYLNTHDFAVDLSSRTVLPVSGFEQEQTHDH